MNRRAVVTGAFSYIGSAVARELCSRGWKLGRSYVNDRERHFGLGHSQPILIP